MRMWKSARARIQGRQHLSRNVPCQDSVCWSEESSVHVAALADGAGSAKFSHFGSEMAVNTVSKLLVDGFDAFWMGDPQDFAKTIAETILSRFSEKANELNCLQKELACTLLFVAVKDDRCIAGHLGDGVIGKKVGERVELLSSADSGEYANETFFVTSKEAWQRLRVFRGDASGIDGFILMSDGAAHCLYDKRSQEFSVVTRQVFGWLEDNLSTKVSTALEKNMAEVFIGTTTDDCSLVIMKRVEISLPQLSKLQPELQAEFLGCSSRGVPNKLKFLYSVATGAEIKYSPSVLAKELGLSVTTVRGYAKDFLLRGFVKNNGGRLVLT